MDILQNSSLAKPEAQMFSSTEIHKLKKMQPPKIIGAETVA